ncbi:MAG: hypothetical protein ACOVRN_06215 [Flavobacterium sp.]
MENQQHNQNVEVDLGAITRKLKQYGTRVNDSFFDGVLFIKRNIIIILILVVAGGVLGTLVDRSEKNYQHHIFVTPNFESNNYLYASVALLNDKVKENDTVFLKQLGITRPKDIAKIEIKPVLEIYKYMDESIEGNMNNRLELFKTMAENGDVDKLIEDKEVSKNYTNHEIIISTNGKYKESELAGPVMKFLNADPYLNTIAAQQRKNLDTKIIEKEKMVAQIDNVLAGFTASRANSGSVYYNDNTPLNEMLNVRNSFVILLDNYKVMKINFNKIINDKARILNQYDSSIVSRKMKVVFPMVFLIIFVIVVRFRKAYKKQMAKRQLQTN